MAKLARKNQKIFAGNATNNGVFGSLQAGSKQLNNDIEVIQSLPAYEEGWNSATISSEKLPPLEEFQGIQYANSYQLAYILQEGIPEWDSNTTYYEGAVCKVLGTPGNFILYSSLINDNIGNPPATSTSAWKAVFNTEFAFATEEWVNEQGFQTVANMSQTVTTSTTQYPSCAAVANFVPPGINVSTRIARTWNTLYTATKNVWVFCGASDGLGNTRYITIDDIRMPISSPQGFVGIFIPISAGQTYRATSTAGVDDIEYYEYEILL